MEDSLAPFTQILTEVILPNLKAVQASQVEQIQANGRLESAIEELHLQLKSQLAELSAQLTSCRAELAATQAVLKAGKSANGGLHGKSGTLIH